MTTLAENGFIVEDRDTDRRNVRDFFHSVRESREQLRMTVLTTLQCNFACDYCIQGDHGDYNKHATKMSLETAARIAEWAEGRLDELGAESYVLTFFGGEPLLNMPVVYYLSERMWHACESRGVRMLVNIITNGLLLTPEVVDRLTPFGLNGVKITLDGDRDTHNQMRPLRGGQGTFDKIISNIRQVAGKCRIAIGGNFDMNTADSYPALLDFLKEQEFADQLSKVTFKPVIRDRALASPAPAVRGSKFIPLTTVDHGTKALNGACMTSAGAGVASGACDSCNVLDDQMSFLREETKKRGFPTVDGVHMGPCEIHKKQRAHDRARRRALRVPRLRRRCEAVHRPHRRPPGPLAAGGRGALRRARCVEGVQRLRVHPGLRRRLHGRRAYRARRHEQTELPQDRPAGRAGVARARSGTRPGARQLIPSHVSVTDQPSPRRSSR